MRSCSRFTWIIFTHVLVMLLLPVFAQAAGSEHERLQFDLWGEVHYSRYNFTDIKKPYDGVDGWTELKIAYWLDQEETLSPYLSFIPTFTTQSEFWWQRNVQFAAGLQWYPFPRDSRYLQSIRLFAFSAWRDYYDEPHGANPEHTDIQVGIDYYYDNLFDANRLTLLAWTNAGFRETNFSRDNYEAFLWTGNVKAGPKFTAGTSTLLPYVAADWTYVPKYEEHWWENYLRMGAGVRWYPKTDDDSDGFVQDLLRRFHVYAEVLHNGAWLGDRPGAADVKETDFRVGFGFSTSGFLRE